MTTPPPATSIRHTPTTVRNWDRAREGLAAVGLSLAILGVTTAAQVADFVASDSSALLADVPHNIGDALTALPVGLASLLRPARAERVAGYAVVFCHRGKWSGRRSFRGDKLIHREAPDHLLALALAGVVGVIGNAIGFSRPIPCRQKASQPCLGRR